MLLSTIKKYWQKIIITTLCVVLLAIFISVIPTPQYRSRAKLLIVQKHSFDLDSYTALRSAERIALTFSQVIYTDSFMKQVLRITPKNETSSLFLDDERKARREWQKKIKIHTVPNSSLLEISVYDKDSEQARQILSGISYVLINRGANYHGGDNIVIKQVDSPLNSKHPVRPNIPLNIILALALGLFGSTAFFYYQSLKEVQQTQGIPEPKKNIIEELDNIYPELEPQPEFIDTQDI